MRILNFNRLDWYRFEHLCKLLGLTVQTDAIYKLTSFLTEEEHPYLRIIKGGKVICIANLN